jgi:hypothetical protein
MPASAAVTAAAGEGLARTAAQPLARRPAGSRSPADILIHEVDHGPQAFQPGPGIGQVVVFAFQRNQFDPLAGSLQLSLHVPGLIGIHDVVLVAMQEEHGRTEAGGEICRRGRVQRFPAAFPATARRA